MFTQICHNSFGNSLQWPIYIMNSDDNSSYLKVFLSYLMNNSYLIRSHILTNSWQHVLTIKVMTEGSPPIIVTIVKSKCSVPLEYTGCCPVNCSRTLAARVSLSPLSPTQMFRTNFLICSSFMGFCLAWTCKPNQSMRINFMLNCSWRYVAFLLATVFVI